MRSTGNGAASLSMAESKSVVMICVNIVDFGSHPMCERDSTMTEHNGVLNTFESLTWLKEDFSG